MNLVQVYGRISLKSVYSSEHVLGVGNHKALSRCIDCYGLHGHRELRWVGIRTGCHEI